jgi:hypothetical protein
MEQLNPVTRFVIDAMRGDRRIPANKVPDLEPIKYLHHGQHVPEEHSVEQVACGVDATTTAHCGSSVVRHHGVVGRDAPEGHSVKQVACGGEASGGGVEVQERAGGVGRLGKEEATAEELRVEHECGEEVVAVVRSRRWRPRSCAWSASTAGRPLRCRRRGRAGRRRRRESRVMSGSGERDTRSAVDRTKCGRGRGRWPRRRPEEEGVVEERVEIVGRVGG